MIELLRIEWLKLKQYRTFRVLTGLYMLVLPLWNYGISAGIMKFGGGKKGVSFLTSAYTFPGVWGHLGFWASFFIMFLSFLMIILVTNEYTFRTNRQNVIDGWSRLQFFHGKVLLVLTISALATIYLFLLGLLFGWVNTRSLSGSMSELYKVGNFFILSVDYLGFGVFLAIWIRKSGLAIGLFLMYSLFLEHLCYGIINRFTVKPYGNLLPLQASDELLPLPWATMARALLPAETTLSMSTYVLGTMAWCLIYYLACRFMLMRRDW